MLILLLHLFITTPSPATIAADAPFNLESLALAPDAKAIEKALKAQNANKLSEALKTLDSLQSPSAALIRARIFRQQQEYEEATTQLIVAQKDSNLAPLVLRESTLLAIAQEKVADATKGFLEVMQSDYPKKSDIGRELAKLLQEKDPKSFEAHYETIKGISNNPNYQRQLVDLRLKVLQQHNNTQAASKLLKTKWVEFPQASSASRKEPHGVTLSNEDRLARAQILLKLHQNEESLTTLRTIATKTMTQAHWCDYSFIAGMAHRKLHNYSKAEKYLLKAMKLCQDSNLKRRAHYVAAKVISIKSGLRAIDSIENFAKNFAGHSMVDDVLFWAGDLYQRRDRIKEATAYYKRSENQPTAGDYCGEARWRRAWIAYRKGKFTEASQIFSEILSGDGCVKETEELSRAHYWLARSKLNQKKPKQALNHFQKAIEITPMGFYGQLSMKRLQENSPTLYTQEFSPLPPTAYSDALKICPGTLASAPQFTRAIALLRRGLTSDALPYIIPLQEKSLEASIPSSSCPPVQPGVLVALLLEKAGAKSRAQWFLRSNFAHYLNASPDHHQLAIMKAAYPLAYRDELQAAEEEHDIPKFFLQALAREESAFNPEIVSWAGAYGLTQLLLSVAKSTGHKFMKPPVKIHNTYQLLDPKLNARLGGALMSSLMKRYKGHKALSLAAYNASVRVGNIWWKRHQQDEFDVFAEELTIRETRHYVKRVLTTYGIYRWLYNNEAPGLPVGIKLPLVKG